MTQASTATPTQCRDIIERKCLTSRDHCEWDVTHDMAAIKFSEQIIVKVVRKDQPSLRKDKLSLGIILHGDVPNLPQTKLGAP